MNQTYDNITIYIRDDGSKDNTLQVIKNMISNNNTSKKIVLLKNNGNNLGYPDCFWELLTQCETADFYAFCDQDDYWYPTKIENAVTHLKSGKENALFFHAYEICNDAMECQYVYSYERNNIRVNNMLFRVIAQGFSIVITDELRKKVLASKPFCKRLPHDLWCLWIAYIYGGIIHTSDVLAKYRRHENAVTSTHGSFWTKVKGAFSNELSGKSLREVQYRFGLLLEYFAEDMDQETQNDLKRFTKENNNIQGYFSKLFYPKRIMPSFFGELVFRLAFLLNRM